MTDYAKLIAEKMRIAQRGKLSGRTAEGRVPPGQRLVTNFPVLDLGLRPSVTAADWRMAVVGLVEQEVALDWAGLLALPQVIEVSDFHCVTHWSQLDMDWAGVRLRDVLALARPLPNAHFATLHGYDGYTTNVPLEPMLADDALVAHSVFGQPITPEHGGPVRAVIPSRYGWKSAKWLKAIELHERDRSGFWEERGYHDNADPWTEERYSNS